MFKVKIYSFIAAGLLVFSNSAGANGPAVSHDSPHTIPASGQSHAPAVMTVPFELVDRLIMVQAEINGVRGNFLVDSGAQTVVVNQARFEEGVINSRPLPHAAPSGAGGTMTEVRGSMDLNLRWGGLSMMGIPGMVTDLTHLEQNLGEVELHGLIGFNVLEPFQVHFDYSKQELTLRALGPDNQPVHPNQAGNAALTLPFEMAGHIPVLPLRVAGLELRMGLDSGAAGDMIFTQWRDELEGEYEFIRRNELTGADRNVQIGDVVQISEVKLAEISYGDMTFRFNDLKMHGDQPYAFDGLLGYEFLQTYPTAINFRSGELMVWPTGP